MSLEGGLSIAMREPGTLCVPVAGKTMGRRQEWSVQHSDIPMVRPNGMYHFNQNSELFL